MSDPVFKVRPATFFELYSRGEVEADSIDDYIERWHGHEEPAVQLPSLPEYLGLTEGEYAKWVEDPGALSGIRDQRNGFSRTRILTGRD